MEVCDASKAMPCYTNRQLIIILSSVWRIPDKVFLTMQREMIAQLDRSLTDTRTAKKVLRTCGGLTAVLTEVRLAREDIPNDEIRGARATLCFYVGRG